MSWLNYILAHHKSPEGYWGCDGNDPENFRHVVEGIYESYEIKSILEIGFNIGCSASMWLEWDKSQSVTLTAVDVCNHPQTIPASKTVQARYGGDRFKFYGSNSREAKPLLEGKSYDMAFVDGDHSYEGVIADTRMVIELGAKVLVYDDWHEKDPQQNGVRSATEDLAKEKLIKLEKVYHIDRVAAQVAVFKTI